MKDFKEVPIIIVTASAQTSGRAFQDIGADDLLIKPYELENLLEKINKYLIIK